MLPTTNAELVTALRMMDHLAAASSSVIYALPPQPELVKAAFPSFPAWAITSCRLPPPALPRHNPVGLKRLIINAGGDISPPTKRQMLLPMHMIVASHASSSSIAAASEALAGLAAAADPTTTSAAVNNSGAARFLAEFAETHKVKTLEFVSLGDFDMPLHEVQFFGSSQPIPNNVHVTFSMFLEKWETKIQYVKSTPTEGENGEQVVLLRFYVRSVRTGKTVTRTESVMDAARRRHKRATIICNKVFEEAWRELQGDCAAKCSTKESGTLFGLKDPRMRMHVLKWYAKQEEQEERTPQPVVMGQSGHILL